MVIVPDDSANPPSKLSQPPTLFLTILLYFIYGDNEIRVVDIDDGQ